LTNLELVAATVASFVFVVLGAAAHRGWLAAVDRRVRERVLQGGPKVVSVARAITILSEPWAHPILGALASLVASHAIGRWTYAPLAASLSTFVLNRGTRLFVYQERPPGAKPRTGLDRLAYPSGHTLAASGIAFGTALEISNGRSGTAHVAMFAVAAAYACTIAWTRLTLDEHWIDDVVGAITGGVAIAVIAYALIPNVVAVHGMVP
jgi:undecaprenyl-diphosphatase